MPALAGRAMGLPINDYFIDIGTLENYYKAQADYADACATGKIMIISQTPLRVSFAGGGTDFARYYREHEGAVVSSAIDKYVFVVVVPRFDELIIVNYSKKETVENVRDLKHELVREAMLRTGVENGVEITTLADVPSEGSGPGLFQYRDRGPAACSIHLQGKLVTAEQLAREACEIEIDICGKPIGKQDQYIAAYGGICHFTFRKDDSVDVRPFRRSTGAVPWPVPQYHAVLHRTHPQSREHTERTGQPHRGQISNTCIASRRW